MSLSELLQHGVSNAWLFIPSAILLGALHGLEPGHSKTMMAAFIVAIRGTVIQAILLGLCATISHTAIVWLVALGGMQLGHNFNIEANEPYFQLVSAVLIVTIGLLMVWRTWREQQRSKLEHGAHQLLAHGYDGMRQRIDTGHGILTVEISRQNVRARWRIYSERDEDWKAKDVTLETERTDGTRETFSFVSRGVYLESIEEVAEPYEFMARLNLSHGHHSHHYDFAVSPDERGHDHIHEELRGLDIVNPGYQDAHELAHANDIRRRFADRHVTTGQIVMFGLTGGLVPCPAAITVLLLCLQLKQIALGALLVLCFSVGLALTLVAAGVVAALSIRQISRHFSGFGELAKRAPYLSSAVVVGVGAYVGFQALTALV